jgi:hypothetical protein
MTNINITKFKIYSCDGKSPIDVSLGIIHLYYYESILDNTVRVTCTFVDAGNNTGGKVSGSILEQIGSNVNAGEKVELQMVDINKQKIYLDGDYSLRVKQIRNVSEDTLKTSYTIDFYSKESIINELVESRVTKRYDGKITDAVIAILKNDCIKTPKNLEIDRSINDFNFIGNTEKPFYKLAWLAKRCVPDNVANAKGNLAGYFFYETGDNGNGSGGYKFKSIDKMFENTPRRKMIFNNTTGLPVGYTNKILEYFFEDTIDIQKKLESGSMFSAELRKFSLFDHGYDGEGRGEFNPSKQFREKNSAGINPIKLGCDILSPTSATRIAQKLDDVGVLPTGKDAEEQIKNSTKENLTNDQIIRQSSARYNNLYNVKLSIATYADFGLHAGDLIHCDFPEISNKKRPTVSKKKSGIYMIADLCHYIDSSGTGWTRMNLVRDTVGRKPF